MAVRYTLEALWNQAASKVSATTWENGLFLVLASGWKQKGTEGWSNIIFNCRRVVFILLCLFFRCAVLMWTCCYTEPLKMRTTSSKWFWLYKFLCFCSYQSPPRISKSATARVHLTELVHLQSGCFLWAFSGSVGPLHTLPWRQRRSILAFCCALVPKGSTEALRTDS